MSSSKKTRPNGLKYVKNGCHKLPDGREVVGLKRSILNIAYFMASIAKANQGVARLSNRFIAEKCGLSKRTVDRWIGLLVEDPPWTEAFDDNPAATLRRKPGLKGCLFDRIRRGRFGDSGPSVYVLKSEVATSLGWKVVYPAEYLPAAVQTDSFG